MKKPASLIYGVDEKPPFLTLLLLGVEHIFIIFIAIIFPVIIVREMGGAISEHNARAFVSLSLLAGGVITVLQAFKRTKVGSGYLCPSVSGPSYLSASILAATTGGLPLLFGMTGFVGFVEVAFSRVMHKLRMLFPTEVTGTVVALVGIVVIPLSVKSFLGVGGNDQVIEGKEVWLGIVTLAIMIGLNIFSKKQLRLFSTIIGMVLGYIFAIIFKIIDPSAIKEINEAPFFALPYIENMKWAFDFKLMIPFTIAALSSTLKTVGDIATCQKVNDSEWKRADMKTVSGGIFADGLGGVLPGLIGGFGQSTSSSNVGLSVATGATSRTISYSIGGLLILLSFFPKLSNVFIIMPKPVMGAALIFAVSFMIVQGFQMVMSRMLDARKIFVVGISLILGLSVDMVPHLYENVHPYIQPIFSSSLSLGAVAAVVLNLIMRIGIKQTAGLQVKNNVPKASAIHDFMEKQGQAWGARHEVIDKAKYALDEILEMIWLNKNSDSDIDIKVTFNELQIMVNLNYQGRLLKIRKRKTVDNPDELDLDDVNALSNYLLQKYADGIKVSTHKELVSINMKFEH